MNNLVLQTVDPTEFLKEVVSNYISKIKIFKKLFWFQIVIRQFLNL